MLKLIKPGVTLFLLTSVVGIMGGACSVLPQGMIRSQSNETALSTDTDASVSKASVGSDAASEGANPGEGSDSAESHTSSPAASSETTTETVTETAIAPAAPASDPYPDAINRASLAFTLSQSAQSPDDWRLVANRWQQAIELMTAVPSSSPNHGEAQQKLTDYRRNLTFARQQAAMPLPEPQPGRIVTVPIEPGESGSSVASSGGQPAPMAATPSSGRVFRAPIVRRSGGTPVILVTFNGSRSFEMIVDTGASGTVITQAMASALNVVPNGSTNVATASASSATFLLGNVQSISVNGATARNVRVAIAGPALSTGLLGNDFFGNYDVTVRRDVVEFRER